MNSARRLADMATEAEADTATAAARVARPFYWYAVFANSVFQRGVFVLFLASQGFSGIQIGLLQTLLYLVSGLAEIPTGFVADRFGRRVSVVLGQLCVAAAIAGQVLVSEFPAFLTLFALQGVGFAFVSGAESALLYDLLRKRGAETSYLKVKSRYTTIGATTMALAIGLGGLLQQVSWQLVYLGSAAALVLAAAVLLIRVPELRGADLAETDETDETAGEPSSGRTALLRAFTARLAALVVVSGLMHATVTPYFIFTQRVLSDQRAPTFVVSAVMAAAFLVGGAAPLLAERADRKLGVRALVPLTLAALGVALALCGLRMPWLTVAVFLLVVGVPDTTAVVLDNVFHESIPSRYRASLLSMITFVESCLIGLGYLVLGALMDAFGPSVGAARYSALPALAALLWLQALRQGQWTR